MAAVGVGGACGTLLRAGIGEFFAVVVDRSSVPWPWPTLVANIVGSFLLGWFVGRAALSTGGGLARPLVAVGLLGSLTTFSSLAVETIDLVRVDGAAAGVLYLGVSICGGLWAAVVGIDRGRR